MGNRRAWGGDEWEKFALQLVQVRHGAHNVQIVPDLVRGDAGIEYFTMDGCLYQSYAPQAVSDVPKAASAMKNKASRDLKKLSKRSPIVHSLLGSLKIERWILLCPFLDDKAVIAHVRSKGEALKGQGLQFLSANFAALVHSLDDFEGELTILRNQARGPMLTVLKPHQDDVRAAAESDLMRRLSEKLKRAFPGEVGAVEHRKQQHIHAHLTRANTLDQMKIDHPELWERSIRCLDAEEQRLLAVGATGKAPTDQLASSLERLETSLRESLPDVELSVITQISVGTLSDWLIRCPLDFPEEGNK